MNSASTGDNKVLYIILHYAKFVFVKKNEFNWKLVEIIYFKNETEQKKTKTKKQSYRVANTNQSVVVVFILQFVYGFKLIFF